MLRGSFASTIASGGDGGGASGGASSQRSPLNEAVDELHLLTPFHDVIARSRTNVVAQRKISWMCQ